MSSSSNNNTNGGKSIREELVKQGVRFLQHPKVQDTPLSERLSFLERKGLTPQEIAQALKLNDEQTALRAKKAVESVTSGKSGERLRGRIGVVLGGNSGVGQLIALYLAQENAKLVLLDVKSSGKSTLELLKEQRRDASGVQVEEIADWQQEQAIEDAMQRAWKAFDGRIDFIVNCIPITCTSSHFLKTRWEDLLGDHSRARSTFVSCRRGVQQMLQQEPNAHGIRGRIVNVIAMASDAASSSSGSLASTSLEKQLTFAVNKAVIRQLTRQLADQFGRIASVRADSSGVISNAVEVKPKQAQDSTEAALEAAHAVLFLVSDENRSIQGANLVV